MIYNEDKQNLCIKYILFGHIYRVYHILRCNNQTYVNIKWL